MQMPEFLPGSMIPFEIASKALRKCGCGTKIFHGCRIVGPERVEIGEHSQIDEAVFVFAGGGVTIGSHVHLAFSSSISGGGECRIDDFVSIGAGARLLTGTDIADGSGLTNPTIPAPFRRVRRGHIHIEPHAVVFTNAVVFPDVVIGEGAVVAAGSLVHRSLKPWGIYAGHPLVQIGVRPEMTIQSQARALRATENPPAAP